MKKIIAFATFLIVAILCFGESPVRTYAADTRKTVETTEHKLNTHIDNISIELEFPVEPGSDYKVTVFYKADKEPSRKMFIRYEDVTEDECVPNILEGQDDRSALLNEVLSPSEEGSRSFFLAAIDDTLNMMVSGDMTVKSIVIEKLEPNQAGKKPTVFFAGDSQLKENSPRVGWAQVIDIYFSKDVNLDNRAIGARSTGSYLRQGRWNALLMDVCPGDYVFIDFGHNDGGSVVGRAVTLKDYKNYLLNQYIDGVRERGAIPVIVSIANRDTVNKNGEFSQTLPDYVEAAKEAASEKGAYFIDLNEKSLKLLSEFTKQYGIGSTTSNLYVDGTHFSEYGAKLMAGLVVEGIKELGDDSLSKFIKEPSQKEFEVDIIFGELPETTETENESIVENSANVPDTALDNSNAEVNITSKKRGVDKDTVFLIFILLSLVGFIGYRIYIRKKK